MSIPVTDEMVVAAKKAFTTTPGAWLDESTHPDDFSDAIRAALTAAVAVAGKDELTGALGAIYEIREATGVGAKPMLSELAEAITAKRDDAIRDAVLKEREECVLAEWVGDGEPVFPNPDGAAA